VKNSFYILRHVTSLIVLTTLLCLGCQRAEQSEVKRITVALPQWFSPSEESPWLQQAWHTIREENPEWAFDLELVPGKTEQVLQKLMVVHASGEGPDLACVRLESMPALVEQGILEPMNGKLPAEVWEALIPALVPSVEWQGKRYVLPYDIGVRVILYRKDLFDAAGIPAPSPTWAWDDLVACARKLTRDLDGNGTIDQWGFGVPAARSRKSILQWLPWFWGLGGELQDKDGEVTLCTPAAVEAMQWYRDLAHKHRVTPPTLYAMDQDTIFQGLAGGLFAMTEGGSWERAMLEKHSPHNEKIGIASLPRARPGGASIPLVDGWGFGLLSKDKEKLPVLARLLEHLCSTEHQLAKYRASGMLSPFQPVYQDPLFSQDPEGRVLAAALRDARPAPALPSFPSISEALEIALQQVLMEGRRPAEALAAQDQRLRNKKDRDP
jgi:multiple sugar transport system substrate-binding protein